MYSGAGGVRHAPETMKAPLVSRETQKDIERGLGGRKPRGRVKQCGACDRPVIIRGTDGWKS